MARNTTLILIFIVCALFISQNGVYAFGAGNIPSFAYMEGRAFRHGDIEDILSQLVKRGAGGAIASLLSKGTKFNSLDVKRVYFGNWLRDYSQAVDVGSLKKMQLQTIITLCMALGFLAHGYATHEFEVTPERLGTYLPTEHIDNPKGYADGEDARKYHPALRGPVDPRELEIDPRTGMKNYIANEQGRWDTSKALVRRTLERCIEMGRRNRITGDKHDEYEAFRLLGQALHTLEDFSAHSNFCELTLISMGHTGVFSHVGDHVRIQAPNGRHVAPLVTGTFGSSDFIHSLLGEATDHLSETSITDLNAELKGARVKSAAQPSRGGPGSSNSSANVLKGLLSAVPGGAGNDMSRDLDSIESMRDSATGGGKRPEAMSPQELHSALWKILTFRDSFMKKIEITIEKIPGLESLVEKISETISIFVLTALEPFLKPVLKVATGALQSSAAEVIDNRSQYEVFDDPRASDPTHSFLSKDHFNLILNEPAGYVAKCVVMYAAKLVTKAWDDKSMNVHQLADEVLQCLFHPDFHNPQSQIQREMLQCVRDWLSKSPNQQSVLQRLSKESVRNHRNMRVEGEGGPPTSQGSFAVTEAHQLQHSALGFVTGSVAGNTRVAGGGGGGLGYPGGPGGYPQAGVQQLGGFPGPPEFPGRPIGGEHQHGGHQHGGHQHDGHQHGGHQHGGHQQGQHHHEHHHSGHQYGSGRYDPTSIYAPPATAPNMSSGGVSLLPLPYSGPSFPSSGPSFPGAERDAFSFPSGDGVLFPDSTVPALPGGSLSLDHEYPPPSGQFPHVGGYNHPPGPPPHSGDGYHAPPGPPPHSGGGYRAPPGPPHAGGEFHAPPGPPPSFGGYGGAPGPPGFPGADTRPSVPPEFPGVNNSSYPYGGGGGW